MKKMFNINRLLEDLVSKIIYSLVVFAKSVSVIPLIFVLKRMTALVSNKFVKVYRIILKYIFGVGQKKLPHVGWVWDEWIATS